MIATTTTGHTGLLVWLIEAFNLIRVLRVARSWEVSWSGALVHSIMTEWRSTTISLVVISVEIGIVAITMIIHHESVALASLV